MSDYFIFDNVDTRNYEGILVYFNSVDATPKRVGEFIEIPNRNGSFFLDGGRYEDVVHTYDIIALSKEHASDLINALASKVGYFRLQDSFNPDEYYSAVLDSEIEPVVTAERDKLTFKVIFTRKPQRWLTSGETKVTIANSGDTITNPTLFDARPMVETTGYGTLTVNGHDIELEDRPLGDVDVLVGKRQSSSTGTVVGEWTIDKSQILAGDTLTMDSQKVSSHSGSLRGDASFRINDPDVDQTTVSLRTQTNLEYVKFQPSGMNAASMTGLLPPATFTEGTASSVSGSASFNVGVYEGTSLVETAIVSFTMTLAYDGDDKITATLTQSIDTDAHGYLSNIRSTVFTSKVIGFSTISAIGNPTYIDCDLGICYMIENDEIIDLNGYIDLGSDLPTLGAGSNTITFDNTFTKIQIVPRWWKV